MIDEGGEKEVILEKRHEEFLLDGDIVHFWKASGSIKWTVKTEMNISEKQLVVIAKRLVHLNQEVKD